MIEMALAGWLFRKLDGMLSVDSPVLVRSLGIAWLSMMWMVWGSHDFWGLMLMGSLALPAIALWIGLPKEMKNASSS